MQHICFDWNGQNIFWIKYHCSFTLGQVCDSSLLKCLYITAPYRSKLDVSITVCAVYFVSCYSLILRLFSVKHSVFLAMFSFFSHLLPLFAVQRQQGYASLQDEAVRVFNSLQEMETLADTVPIIQGILQTCQDLRPLRDEVLHLFFFF